MKIYNRCMWALLGLNLILGLIILPSMHRLDLFPFSSYALFDLIYKETSRPIIYFEELDSEKISPPLSAYKAVPLNSPGFLCFNDQLHESVQKNSEHFSVDKEGVSAALRCLLPDVKSAKYQIRWVHLEQFKFLESGETITEQQVGQFVFNQ